MDETTDRSSRQEPASKRQVTTDFSLLHTDLTVHGTIRKAPNPLRAADPVRLQRYRADLYGIIAARRAGTDFRD